MKPKAIVFGSSFSGYHNEPVGPSVFKTLADLGDSQEYIHLFADREYLEWEADAKQYSSQRFRDRLSYLFCQSCHRQSVNQISHVLDFVPLLFTRTVVCERIGMNTLLLCIWSCTPSPPPFHVR